MSTPSTSTAATSTASTNTASTSTAVGPRGAVHPNPASSESSGRDSREVLLQGRGMTKHYGGVIAVSNVDISVRAGEILGLVGPNGAGKTTLVDIITGAQPATGGELTLLGRPLTGSPARRARQGLARTFQHPLLSPEETVLENLLTGVSAHRFHSVWGMMAGVVQGVFGSPAGDIRKACALAEELGITDLQRLAGDLSLGEQRLVEVARALAQDPKVMLLDEPFAGADSGSVVGIIEAIREVQRRDRGVILVDHNVDLIASLADRVLLLDFGKVVFDGPPAECLASPEMQTVYFGADLDDPDELDELDNPAELDTNRDGHGD